MEKKKRIKFPPYPKEFDEGKFDKRGNPITLEEWANLTNDREYKVVKQTRLWWGGLVSTVWLGLDHNHGFGGEKAIFETMLFSRWDSLDCFRYSSLELAETGHEAVVRHYGNPLNALPLFPRILRKYAQNLRYLRGSRGK